MVGNGMMKNLWSTLFLKSNKMLIKHFCKIMKKLIEFTALGVEVICTEETLSKSFENELVEDMLSLITVFSAKIYGRRGKKKIINEDKSS